MEGRGSRKVHDHEKDGEEEGSPHGGKRRRTNDFDMYTVLCVPCE